jgi:dihydrofolate reductase
VTISFVVAVAENGVIGRNNALPWRLPGDLKHFKEVTLGRPVLMGRKTWDSIGRPLPGRHNIVVSRRAGLGIEGCTVVTTVDQALELTHNDAEIMVIGGAEIFNLLLPNAARVYLTRVHANVAGDVYLPELGDSWVERSREYHKADERHEYAYSFVLLERDAPAIGVRRSEFGDR